MSPFVPQWISAPDTDGKQLVIWTGHISYVSLDLGNEPVHVQLRLTSGDTLSIQAPPDSILALLDPTPLA
jgi:hypothetical protein